MKKALIIIFTLLCSAFLHAQCIEDFVNRQLETYPQSRLLDLYKSCFQDFMGAEHLVGFPERAWDYLERELAEVESDSLMAWYYEPCGFDGRHVRVSLRAVIDSVVAPRQLFDCFVRSANAADKPSLEQWKQRWSEILATIDHMQLTLPQYDIDREFIDSVLAQGQYAISHSPDYRKAYRPHYRIVERNIFDTEIKPLIEAAKQ